MSEEINKEFSEYPKETELANFYLDVFGNLACSLNIDFRDFNISLKSYNQGDENYTAKEYEKVYYEVAKLCNESKEYEIDIYDNQIAVRTKEEKEQIRYDTKTEKEKEEYFIELKQAKREEINKARDKAEQGGFLYLGKMFDSDPISCQRIALASQTALISMQSQTEFSVEWTCQDNDKITLSAEQTVEMSVALTQWSNSCHIKATELKNLIKNATTKEELDKISWDMEQISTESTQRTTIL